MKSTRTETTPSQEAFSTLAYLQKNKKIYLDDSFQSQERWSDKDKQEYMASLLEGRAITSIILADLASLVAALKIAFTEENEDYKFFKNLIDQNYQYITIDGNNRDRCISDFVEKKFALINNEYNTGTSYLPSFKADSSNNRYDTLPANAKKFIDDIEINLLVVTQCDRRGLADLFIAVNKGMNLNAQERRNAIMCVFGAEVRKLVKKLYKPFNKIYTDKAMNRRAADEMVVTASVICARGIDGITGSDRDIAYVDNSKELSVFSTTVTPIMTDILNEMVEPYGVGGIKIDDFESGNFIDLIMLMNYMRENKIVIENYKDFYNWWSIKQNERTSNPDILYIGSGTNKRTYSGLLRGTGKNFLKIRYDFLVESLGTIPDGVVTFRDRDRTFDPKLRYTFWKRQEGICPLEKKYIEPRFIWDTSVTHLDHDIPWSKEGETSEENGQLTFADANIAKGNHVFKEVKKVALKGLSI
jgi:hypothetical protein